MTQFLLLRKILKKSHYNIENKDGKFLAIGRLTKQKLLFLIDCFSELIKDYPDINCYNWKRRR